MAPYIALAACAVVARLSVLVRLAWLGLLRRYPWFALYVLVGTLQQSAWLFGTPGDAVYARFWVITTPISISLSILSAIELWALVMGCYPGVQIIYRWLIPFVVALAILAALATGIDLWGIEWRATEYRIISLTIRYTATLLTFVCGFLAFWMDKFNTAPRNLEKHALLLTGYFASVASGNLIIHLLNGHNELVGPILTGISAGFFGLWVALLSREGEAMEELPASSLVSVKIEYQGLMDLMRATLAKRS